MPNLLVNQTIAITGVTSGLGKALSLECAAEGANLILLGRNQEKLDELKSELYSHFPNQVFSPYQVDVINNQNVEQTFSQIFSEGKTVDALVNNAGVIYKAKLEDSHEWNIHTIIDTNVKGVIFCTKAVIKHMKDRDKGKIVNVISNQGKIARAEQSIYGASKFAVHGFTEALQKELMETNVHVYGVYPAGMKTDLFAKAGFEEEDMQHCMDPHDVAKVIIFMLTQPDGVYLEDVSITRKYCKC